jgi:hypothetical protein
LNILTLTRADLLSALSSFSSLFFAPSLFIKKEKTEKRGGGAGGGEDKKKNKNEGKEEKEEKENVSPFRSL